MNLIIYFCIWIVGGNCPMKAETRTPFPDTFVRDCLKTGIMKKIPLTQGQFALVDDEDYDYLMQWKWIAHRDKLGNTYYAERYCPLNGEQAYLRMHRAIMQTPKGMECDHIDHNGLNNQKENLRNCTHRQNMINQKPRGRSKYRGVSWKSRMGKWCVGLGSGGKYHIGYFDDEIKAAIAYDCAAKELYGAFANLNFK